MGRQHAYVYALNAGGVDPEAIARVDLERMRLAGEHPVKNLLPRVLGPSTLRPGTENLFAIPDNDESRFVRFWKDDGAGYVLLLSPSEMRVVHDGTIQQVVSVSTAISSGSWTDESDGAATATGGASLTLNASRTHTARLRQSVSVASGDQAKVHVLKVVVSAGPVYLRIGTTAGGAELMPASTEAEIDNGTHQIAFTPGVGTVYVDVFAYDSVVRSVSSIAFAAAGDFVVPTPWSTVQQIEALRAWQSLDVLFVGDGSNQQRRIEHRGPLSWGIALYRPNAGPFVAGNERITLTPAATSGNTTLTASQSLFQSGHVGTLVELTHIGRVITETLSAADEATDYVTIIGIDAGRYFYRTAVGSSFVGTLVLERSFEPIDPTTWSEFATFVDGAATFARTRVNDTQDNVTVHYRFRVSAYTSGSVDVSLDYDSDVQVGRARITGYTSATSVTVEVLEPFGLTTASRQWRMSAWSDVSGWPRTPVIHDGRLHWFRADLDYASVPDDYPNFDDTTAGDGAPFARSVGSGGEAGVLWALSMDRLIVGTSRSEAVIAASEFDAPLTPTAYTVRRPSRRGSADIAAVEHNDGLFFAGRGRRRLYEMSMVSTGSRYEVTDVSRLNPAAYMPGIARVAVQQHPETRHYAVMDDGTVSVLTYERRDEVIAVTQIAIDGCDVEDVCVLPNVDQDDVYLIVNRGGTRYVERFAAESDQQSKSTCTLLDSHKVLTGAVSSITGGTHLAGQTVQVWTDGVRHADVTLDGSGVAALTGGPFARVVYGKAFTADFKSVKLAYAAQLGDAVGQTKMVHGAGLVLHKSCLDGILVGPDFDHLEALPQIYKGAVLTPNQLIDHYDQDIFPINAEWTPDARLVVRVNSAEGPVTVQGVVIDVETRDGAA